MSNTWFQFKQFTIHQDRCGMKVSTDACIQGAWVPILPQVRQVLDIGAGTGLLSLMLAQRNSDMYIDAIELDEAAAAQAKENVASSPWAERINVIQGDVRKYSFATTYDMIICNPPFFDDSLQSADSSRNNARHNVALSKEDIIALAGGLLRDEGYLAIMLPVAEHVKLERMLSQNNWRIFQSLHVLPKAGQQANRIISLACRHTHHDTSSTTGALQIKDEDGRYRPEFIQLLHPFYLFL